jgi:hypothetical protein
MRTWILKLGSDRVFEFFTTDEAAKLQARNNRMYILWICYPKSDTSSGRLGLSKSYPFVYLFFAFNFPLCCLVPTYRHKTTSIPRLYSSDIHIVQFFLNFSVDVIWLTCKFSIQFDILKLAGGDDKISKCIPIDCLPVTFFCEPQTNLCLQLHKNASCMAQTWGWLCHVTSATTQVAWAFNRTNKGPMLFHRPLSCSPIIPVQSQSPVVFGACQDDAKSLLLANRGHHAVRISKQSRN